MGFDSRKGTFHHCYIPCTACGRKGMYKPQRPKEPEDLHIYTCKFCGSKVHELDIEKSIEG